MDVLLLHGARTCCMVSPLWLILRSSPNRQCPCYTTTCCFAFPVQGTVCFAASEAVAFHLQLCPVPILGFDARVICFQKTTLLARILQPSGRHDLEPGSPRRSNWRSCGSYRYSILWFMRIPVNSLSGSRMIGSDSAFFQSAPHLFLHEVEEHDNNQPLPSLCRSKQVPVLIHRCFFAAAFFLRSLCTDSAKAFDMTVALAVGARFDQVPSCLHHGVVVLLVPMLHALTSVLDAVALTCTKLQGSHTACSLSGDVLHLFSHCKERVQVANVPVQLVTRRVVLHVQRHQPAIVKRTYERQKLTKESTTYFVR